MFIFIISRLISSKEIHIRYDAADGEPCESGCNSKTAKRRVNNGDSIDFIQREISGSYANDFLDIFNAPNATNVIVIGNGTKLNFDFHEKSEKSLIFTNDSHIVIQDIIFNGLNRFFMTSENANIEFNNVSFINCNLSNSSFINASGGEFIFESVNFINCSSTAEDFITLSITQSKFNIVCNGSKFVNMFNTYGNEVNIRKCVVSDSKMKSFIYCYDTSAKFDKSVFEFNIIERLIFLKTECELKINKCIFSANRGMVLDGYLSSVGITDTLFDSYESNFFIIFTNQTVFDISESNITHCEIGGFLKNVGHASTTNINTVKAKNINSSFALFEAYGGTLEITNLKASRINTTAKYALFRFEYGVKISVCNVKASKLSSTNKALRSLCKVKFIMQTTFENIAMTKSMLCGINFVRSKGVVNNVTFSKNTCFKGDKLEGFVALHLSNARVFDSLFELNKANNGNVVVENGSIIIHNTNFQNSTANAGTGVFSSLSNIEVYDSFFNENKADLCGASIYIDGGSLKSSRSSFSLNKAPRGPVIYISRSEAALDNLAVDENFGNGTFIYAIDNSTISILNSSVFDPYELAITANKATVQYNQTNFNTKSSAFVIIKKHYSKLKAAAILILSASLVFVLYWVYRRFGRRMMRGHTPKALQQPKGKFLV